MNLPSEIGLPPGSVIHYGEKKSHKIKISQLDYSKSESDDFDVNLDEECPLIRGENNISWVHVNGVHDVEIIKKFGENFQLHPLLLEDIANTEQVAKIAEYEDLIYINVKSLSLPKDGLDLKSEQISLVVGKSFLISFSENKNFLFQAVRRRIKKGRGKIREKKTDYLCYALLDFVVDQYSVLFGEFEENLNKLEESILEKQIPEYFQRLYQIKKTLLTLRRKISPFTEIINTLLEDNEELIEEENQVFFRDVRGNVRTVLDTISKYQEQVTSLIELYLSLINNKTNEIMKTLAVISTFFLPLTFIAGIYGMNFKRMPELEHALGYPIVIGFMCLVAGGIGLFMKFKKWL